MGFTTVTDEWSPKMEDEEKLDLMRFMEEDEQKNNNLDGSFLVIDNDDVDNRRLLTGLINQLETLRDDEQVCQPQVAEEEASSPAVDPKSKTAVEAESVNSESERQEDIIIKELKKIKRQNVITHCLLSAMILLTLAWQVSEVSLILKVKGKVKDGMSHPFRSFGSMITGILKRNDDQDRKHSSPKRNTDAFPPLNISELCHMDFPVSDQE